MLGTWNMQGANHSTENKWNTGVRALFNSIPSGGGGITICCLQECGSVPASAQRVQLNCNVPQEVEVYLWGTARSGIFIVYYPWDLNGNRCNLAIVTRDEPQGIVLLWPTALPMWRPVLGIALGGVCYFTIHAISPGGSDVPGLLNSVQFNVNNPWIVAGDFNRVPTPIAGINGVLCRPNRPTYPTTHPLNQFDYAVRSNGTPAVQGEVLDLIMSDHLPVKFRI
jgi:cytolethal distending toxin subunit B